MTIEPVTSSIDIKTVRPKPDADQARPDGHGKHGGGGRQSKEDRRPEAHPVLNDQGQVTGKLIDVRA